MQSDIAIAQQAKLERITQIAKNRLDIADEHLEPYGHYKAKISLEYLKSLESRPDGKLILVTAISPTPAGEGKTTTTVGLGDALNRIGKKTMICLREPSLGPVFGVKGGAAGGGYAQIVPMEDINLHFTGDFHAIAAAHNLLSALIDNHINHGNDLKIDPRLIQWKRVVDMNDRALRKIVVGLGGTANGFVREDGYDIVVASEVMAILCLASSLQDLKERLGRIIIGYRQVDRTPIYASDLKAHGAMATLLKDAIKPNLVQTLENNPAIIHGGPFANIAHGCNSVIATKAGLKMADYVVTEAGFGADLGAEKFVDIKCRMAGLNPAAVVLVATIRALKFHGGVAKDDLNKENVEALRKGLVNLERHMDNIRTHFGLPCVVSVNHFNFDTEAEIQVLRERVEELGGRFVLAKHWAEGGKGAEEVAKTVVQMIEQTHTPYTFVYPSEMSLEEKIKTVATKIYRAGQVTFADSALKQLREWDKHHGSFPVCMAKTQMSFSTDPSLKGAPTGHTVHVREVRIANGAGFVVAICGDMMTMPGLPKVPSAEKIDIDANGQVVGLF
ncbi:formate--tetrahydrofolate ligase [Ferrovum sp. PN-J185]|uniref:formate--tetrahydrofolate ligase n=1 Tax=Ferrovum sp. PN-J185 TaxID=1356306 RepID=UPI000794279C|nr:formate--tetrahydrofolate ligase [Ferrovum sp. PN-J185]KXW56409.1 formate--tetrahydrofolate ligase [Ferrovum sp. PN-J185]MCC6069132.1 formate--tetrahydrofolate ligase [Ferrovum sp. PN-J185]